MPKETYAEAVYRLDLADYEKREADHLRDYEQKKARLAGEHDATVKRLNEALANGDARRVKLMRKYLEHVQYFQRQADDMWANRHRSKPPTPPSSTEK
ncbi:hypothetical protein [Streptomyces sp. NPDC060243]|uniref:hypothetical protein n=1 Tax=Streptomyces sp. NPDC060243 TaxID=3347081 RepID=UPI0036493677